MENEKRPKKELQYDLYLDALADGAARSRTILTFLFVGSFLVFLALTNSFGNQASWFASRLSLMKETSKWILFKEDIWNQTDSSGFQSTPIRLPGETVSFSNVFEVAEFLEVLGRIPSARRLDKKTNDGLNKLLRNPHSYLFRFPDELIHYPTLVIDTSLFDGEKLLSVLRFLKERQFPNRKDFESVLERLERANIEHRLIISVPIIGLSIDINNLCWASAIAFSLFYFLLLFSLSRERKNLKLAFEIGKEKGYLIQDIYRLLSMRQVLTSPPSIDEDLNFKSKKQTPLEQTSPIPKKKTRSDLLQRSWFRNNAPKVAIRFPMLVWAFVWAYDIYTIEIGVSLNNSLWYSQMTVCTALGVIVYLLQRSCLSKSKEIEMEWRDYAKKVKTSLEAQKRINEKI
jgi:hypothetical protein